jgi:isopenicillin N synthase-like dioxygenase
MIRYPPQVPNDKRTALLPHTDYGTLTLLASPLGGLQILSNEATNTGDTESGWRYIKPQPGCVVVNVGDALVEWTGGLLHSNLHRATFAPGLQGECVRHSIAYLIRPERNVSMRRLAGGRIPAVEVGDAALDLTASEWEIKKAMSLKAGVDIARSRGGTALNNA